MIELPDTPGPSSANPSLLDFGASLVPPTGARELRVDRPGNRYMIEVNFPPMKPDDSRVFVSRLLEAKRKGVRVPYPLGVPQGAPGKPVIDGAGQAGIMLALRDFTPHYRFKEGYWFSIEDENGQHYLHNCRSVGSADAAGEATIQIEPALRHPFLDGAKLHFAKPMIEGLPQGDSWGWQIPVHHLIALSVPIREVA
ncbi:hypothetical protein [Aurantiacibacter luteus]|uniref:Uncharacterized protein n=1 Tax=Aurantiacibacter luteus TaxID=1581420 RepID=A0A0G9MPD2_9SPHN|nr:hypothetical protein [Aurantiacibacter luteus]KLE32459.1 hypothetical protein AAW00_13625 [Aurantiacibacter luteus]